MPRTVRSMPSLMLRKRKGEAEDAGSGRQHGLADQHLVSRQARRHGVSSQGTGELDQAVEVLELSIRRAGTFLSCIAAWHLPSGCSEGRMCFLGLPALPPLMLMHLFVRQNPRPPRRLPLPCLPPLAGHRVGHRPSLPRLSQYLASHTPGSTPKLFATLRPVRPSEVKP